MTANRRIFLNIIATYGRSLLAMFCGLAVSRWVLEALGAQAYGIYGVVGVLLVLIDLVSGLLSTSISRFYAFEVGKMKLMPDSEKSNAEMRGWFNSALLMQCVIVVVFAPIALVVGEWAIEHYFDIPGELKASAHWVFYFSLITASVRVSSVPFRAIYVAQQLIAELTLYEVMVPVVSLGCAFLLLHIDSNRLFWHAFYTMLLAIVPAVVIDLRALAKFPFCKIAFAENVSWRKAKDIVSFAGWQLFGWLGLTARSQGCATVINKCLGVEYNATMTVANTVNGQVESLSAALAGAFAPAVTNAAGAADRDAVYRLAMRACRFGAILCAVFAVPLIIEMDFAIGLWLKVSPPRVCDLCKLMLVCLLVSKMSGGMLTAILSSGRIKAHEIGNGLLYFSALVVCLISIAIFGFGILGVGIGYLTYEVGIVVYRAILWKVQLGFPLKEWAMSMVRYICVIIATGVCVWGLSCFVAPSFVRLMLSGMVSVFCMSTVSLYLLLSKEERLAIISRLPFLKRGVYA